MLGATAALGGAAALPSDGEGQPLPARDHPGRECSLKPTGAMQEFRQLGANTVRVVVPWANIAPGPTATKKPSFNATDPNAYPAADWAPFDAVVEAAHQYGIKVDFTVSGARPGGPEGRPARVTPDVRASRTSPGEPNAAAYGQFVQAVGKRYDGRFVPRGQITPLPAGQLLGDLQRAELRPGPRSAGDQRTRASPTGPMMYRGLANAG